MDLYQTAEYMEATEASILVPMDTDRWELSVTYGHLRVGFVKGQHPRPYGHRQVGVSVTYYIWTPAGGICQRPASSSITDMWELSVTNGHLRVGFVRVLQIFIRANSSWTFKLYLCKIAFSHLNI